MERELPRSKARLPSLLLALLGLGPELLFGQARAQPQQVNGVLGGSVLLSPALPPNKTVKEIEWSFSAGTGAMIQVAEFSRGGFERPDPRDRFGKRLERYNETALRIRALERGDSGVYGARIKLHPALVEDQTFNLSVYGGLQIIPVPASRLSLSPPGAATPQTRQVNGVLGGSALLSLDLPPDKKVKAIEWTFLDVSSVKILVGEFSHSGPERSDPQDRFGDRLEMNKTALRIGTLERGDSGLYEARIKLPPAIVETQLFALSVYDPVPEPQIQGQRLSLTPRECNLTLRCQAPPGSNAAVTWQLGGSLGVPQAQLCGDNQTLCLALPVVAFNSTYTCLARNPAQERSVSVHLDTLCQQQDTGACQRRHVCLVLVAVGILALLGIAWIWRRRRRRRRKKSEGGLSGTGREQGQEETASGCPRRGSGALSPLSSEDPPPELLYSEIQSRNSLEPREWQDGPRTIYCEVQAKV
ncbi:PREDICTED: SLAM family member 9-like [Lepidothrix coronata]|uniref:SLAM family member 9-like n=1 Tax=Lepidothrix coronata TaxID=321398 RepID=A0A6J0J8J7_9PASS|nr:PREDICTED: SLAM family member 9-like [Lepidothrix coronata]